MATEHVTRGADAPNPQASPAPAEWAPDAERAALAQHASWDVEICTDYALRAVREFDDAEAQALMMALLLRVKQLNNVIMGALGDKDEPIEKLRDCLQGEA